MILSNSTCGLVRQGSTQLASSIVIEQTGPCQLTVRAGTFVTPDGIAHQLASDQVLDLVADATYPKLYRAFLVSGPEGADVLLQSLLLGASVEWPAWPEGYQIVAHLLYDRRESIVDAGLADMTAVPFYVLTVEAR